MRLITIDFRSRKLIYKQLVDNIKDLIMNSQIKTDETLPSVRSLAKELGINPNTIQKAYTELERQGVIASYPGRGSVVCTDASVLADMAKDAAITEISAVAAKCGSGGMTEDEFVELCRIAWRNRTDGSLKGGNAND